MTQVNAAQGFFIAPFLATFLLDSFRGLAVSKISLLAVVVHQFKISGKTAIFSLDLITLRDNELDFKRKHATLSDPFDFVLKGF